MHFKKTRNPRRNDTITHCFFTHSPKSTRIIKQFPHHQMPVNLGASDEKSDRAFVPISAEKAEDFHANP